MTKKFIALLLALCCVVCFSSCQSAHPEIERDGTTARTTAETTTTEKQIKAVPPIDIADVPFVLAEMDCYLKFDKDGLAMPEIRALFEEEKAEYEENIEEIYRDGWPFTLEAAEYDMNGDGKMDYVVEWYHYDINPGNWGTIGFFDVIYRSGGKLKRMHTNNEMNITYFNPVVLNTKANGFHDIASKGFGANKFVWEYDGTGYIENQRNIEKEVDIYRMLSGGDDVRLEDGKIYFEHHFDLTTSTQDHPPFFIAGLFKTAQKDGIVTHERLWCCDENGDPKLFMDQAMSGAFFCDEYGGKLPDDENPAWPDEVEVVIYEP